MGPLTSFKHLDRLADLGARLWWKMQEPIRIETIHFRRKLTDEERFAFVLGWREADHCVREAMKSNVGEPQRKARPESQNS